MQDSSERIPSREGRLRGDILHYSRGRAVLNRQSWLRRLFNSAADVFRFFSLYSQSRPTLLQRNDAINDAVRALFHVPHHPHFIYAFANTFDGNAQPCN